MTDKDKPKVTKTTDELRFEVLRGAALSTPKTPDTKNPADTPKIAEAPRIAEIPKVPTSPIVRRSKSISKPSDLNIPFYQKIKYSSDVLMERAMPNTGQMNAKVGDKVEPFTRLALTKVSTERVRLGTDEVFKASKSRAKGDFYYMGEIVGYAGYEKFIAPFNGILSKINKIWIFAKEAREFWVLSGLWGEVADVYDTKSVQIKTNFTDINFAACTDREYSGELVVFPNPTELLSTHYLEKFPKDAYGAIIYIGNFLSTENLRKAIDMGVGGILAGSTDRSNFALANDYNVFLGTFMGFGNIPTPNPIYEILKTISNRYVFLQGSGNLLRIPSPAKFTPEQMKDSTADSLFKTLEVGLYVAVLQKPYFGYCGVVEKIIDSSIVVRLEENNEAIDISAQNVIALG